MVRYPVKLAVEDGQVVVTFPDIPWAQTFGEDKEEALARAVDALETALIAIISDRDPIPAPTLSKRGPFVVLPALSEAKVSLYRTMRDQKVGKAELARRLNWHLPQVDRLLDLRHASRLDQIEAAFRALNKRLGIEVMDAA